MLSRRKFIQLATPALILPSRKVCAAFSSFGNSNHSQLRYPVALDATKKYFIDQFGSPCYACGDSPQVLPNMLGTSDIELFLSNRAARGMNIFWMIFPDNSDQTTPPNNFYGNAPFSGSDFTNFNNSFWNYVDYIMDRCLYYGQTVLFNVAFIGLNIGGATSGYLTPWKAASTATLQGYATFLANRYRNCPNLIWLLGGDADPTDATLYSQLDIFAQALKTADPNHLLTMEATRFHEDGTQVTPTGYSSADAHIVAYGAVKPWLDINWVYPIPSSLPERAQTAYGQGLPCLMGEDWYYPEHSMTFLLSRNEMWSAVLGGCTLGRIAGNGAIWSFNSINGSACCTSGSPSWQSQLSAGDSVGQQFLGNAMRSREFWKMAPDTTNSVMTSGTGVCGRTSDGQSIIAYMSSTQTLTFDMTKITDAGNQAIAHWFDPNSGSVRNAGTFAISGTQSFTGPGTNSAGDTDWTLFIDSVAANLRPPGT